MERALEKMAKQLNAYDESSLMRLWQQYALRVHEFEPSKRWEEAALVLSFIQAVRWKNQLFNYHLAQNSSPVGASDVGFTPAFLAGLAEKTPPTEAPAQPKQKATRLPFPPKKE